VSFSVNVLDPASEFIDTLDDRMQAKIVRTIELLKTTGPLIRMPHAKKIVGHENLFELRIQFASNIVRLFYFYANGRLYVITSGYVKKDQKLDSAEILKAIKLRDLYAKENNP